MLTTHARVFLTCLKTSKVCLSCNTCQINWKSKIKTTSFQPRKTLFQQLYTKGPRTSHQIVRKCRKQRLLTLPMRIPMDAIFSEDYFFATILNFVVKGCEVWNQEIFLVPGLAPADRKIQNGRERKHFFHAWIKVGIKSYLQYTIQSNRMGRPPITLSDQEQELRIHLFETNCKKINS